MTAISRMTVGELLAENTRLRQVLNRPERSRFTQLRADLLRENKEMAAELASYSPPIDKTVTAVKRPMRSKRLRPKTPRPGKFHWKFRDCTAALSVEAVPMKRCNCGALIQRMRLDEFSLVFDVCMACRLTYHVQ